LIFHNPVLLQTACNSLDIVPKGKYIDCTLGAAGHAIEIVRRGGVVLGIDQDVEAILACPQLDNLKPILGNFRDLKSIATTNNFYPVNGVLMDVGVSSHELDQSSRGFSFQKSGPLDMRMSKDNLLTADEIVNTWPKEGLEILFQKYAELNTSVAAKVAERIVKNRPYVTTTELAKNVSPHERVIFQAIRITVNDELEALKSGLNQAIDILNPSGKIVVISFHSLEDRIVKHQFAAWENNDQGKVITKHPILPTEAEVEQNPRSKSAKLRVFQKNETNNHSTYYN